MGMANTNKIYARLTAVGGAATTAYAAGVAWAYENNGKTDWHLPSVVEMTQMCKWQRGRLWTSDATACSSSGTVNTGTGASGFLNFDSYHSSSEATMQFSWRLNGVSSNEEQQWGKSNGFKYKIVRAFS